MLYCISISMILVSSRAVEIDLSGDVYPQMKINVLKRYNKEDRKFIETACLLCYNWNNEIGLSSIK